MKESTIRSTSALTVVSKGDLGFPFETAKMSLRSVRYDSTTFLPVTNRSTTYPENETRFDIFSSSVRISITSFSADSTPSAMTTSFPLPTSQTTASGGPWKR